MSILSPQFDESGLEKDNFAGRNEGGQNECGDDVSHAQLHLHPSPSLQRPTDNHKSAKSETSKSFAIVNCSMNN